MKIQYMSDLHLEFKENAHWLKEHQIPVMGDVLVLAGDTIYLGDDSMMRHPFWDWASESYRQVIVCLGNHEFYKYYDLSTLKEGMIGEIRHNVHWYYNVSVKVDDIDFIVSTLWAYIPVQDAFQTERCVSDFHRIMYNGHILTAIDFNEEHERCLNFIKDSVLHSTAKKKIVVTHHVPSFELSSPDFKGSPINGAFTVEIGNYIAYSDIDYWIYGHSHRNIDGIIGNTKCLSNQLGYTFHGENTDYEPSKYIEI